MPTAAKLVAAVIFAMIGFLTAEAVVPLLPEGQKAGRLYQIAILVPIICGWRVIGRLVGKSYMVAVNSGIYATVVSLFFVLTTLSVGEMLKRSTRKAYDGPVEAVVNTFGIALEYGLILIASGPLTVLITGALIVGPVCEWVNRRWS